MIAKNNAWKNPRHKYVRSPDWKHTCVKCGYVLEGNYGSSPKKPCITEEKQNEYLEDKKP